MVQLNAVYSHYPCHRTVVWFEQTRVGIESASFLQILYGKDKYIMEEMVCSTKPYPHRGVNMKMQEKDARGCL